MTKDKFSIVVLESKEVLLSEIIIESRMRIDFGDIDELADSIKELGLIHPIALDKNKRLISGFRRYKAHEKLGFLTIRAEIFDLDITSKDDNLIGRCIELEENIKRKSMTWDEMANLRVTIHNLRVKIHGSKVHNRDPDGWSAAMTAKLLSVNPATISIDQQLVDAIKEFPELGKCESRETAIKRLSKIKEHKLLTELARRRGREVSDLYKIFQGDCRELITIIPDETIDLVIFDPPWGIGANKNARTEETYDDTPKTSLELQLDMLPKLYKVMKPGTIMYYFFGIEFYNFLYGKLLDTGFTVRQVPLVWIKPNPGLAVDNRFGTQYESILFVSKGEPRALTKHRGDVFSFARVPAGKAIAAAEKPVELIAELIALGSVDGEYILDPTMGSGVTIEAALRSKRRAIGFEQDQALFDKIQYRLDKSDPTITTTEQYVKELLEDDDFDEEIDLKEEN